MDIWFINITLVSETMIRKKEDRLIRSSRAVSDDSDTEMNDMDMDGMSKGALKKQKKEKKEEKKRATSLARSHSRPREPSQVGLKDEAAEKVAKKLDKQGRKQWPITRRMS